MTSRGIKVYRTSLVDQQYSHGRTCSTFSQRNVNHCRRYYFVELPLQEDSAQTFARRIFADQFLTESTPYGMVLQWASQFYVSMPWTVRTPYYTVQSLFIISTVMAALAQCLLQILSVTISCITWYTFRYKKFGANVLAKSLRHFFVTDELWYGKVYELLICFNAVWKSFSHTGQRCKNLVRLILCEL